jgi:hypothetical protein
VLTAICLFRPGKTPPELAREQPHGTGIYREVAIEARHGRRHQVQVALLAMAGAGMASPNTVKAAALQQRLAANVSEN